jgi:hypothetical protein
VGRRHGGGTSVSAFEEDKMPTVCPHDGHLAEDAEGPFCRDHGAQLFTRCQACGALWPTTADRESGTNVWGDYPERGADFCEQCGLQAPWVSRPKLFAWLAARLSMDATVPADKKFELRALLDKLKTMAADDEKTLPGWMEIKKVAPKLWVVGRPVLDVLIGEGVKKVLGI